MIYLILSIQSWIAFKGEVSNGPAQGKIAINSIALHKSACIFYSSSFQRIARFMISTQRLRPSVYRCDTSAIAHISDIQVFPPVYVKYDTAMN